MRAREFIKESQIYFAGTSPDAQHWYKPKHAKYQNELENYDESVDESLRTKNPCWKGYKPVGTKKKNGKTVPNCVPK